MIITLVKAHDKTKGPEAHQTWIFNLQSETAGEGHAPTVFTYQGEQYRAFRTYAQVPPLKKDGKSYPIAQVCAIKVADEKEWIKNGRQGKFSPEAEELMRQHTAK